MNDAYFWSSVIPLGIGTLLIRMSFIFLSKYLSLSKRIERLFTFIPAAVFPAIFAPMVFFYKGDNHFLLHQERVLAFAIAMVVAFKTKNILLTILTGLIVHYFL
jgi:branched-subunit amino acid transport protein